jgi:MFS family permease
MNVLARLHKDQIVAPPGFNRWRVPPASIAIHLCIGSVYAWSIFNPPLLKTLGVVGASSEDWELRQVVWIFSVAILFLGLSAALAGKWLAEVGPRMVGVAAAMCWGCGLLIGSVGVATHQLWVVYLGYGVVGGCGLGLGYVSPVSTLIKWFPDRRGMAAGMAIMGFGGGAMLAAPLKEWCIRFFYRAPDYLGAAADVDLVTQGGKRLASVAGSLREVVVVGANDVASMIVPGAEGVYVVGTGSTGVAATFIALGLGSMLVMFVASFAFRVPAEGWAPEGYEPEQAGTKKAKMITTANVGVNEALRTPQFYLLWIVLCLNVTAGIGVLGVAKTMMTEIFGTTLPKIVDGAFAATYVLAISVFNMAGRFFWATVSDVIGRKSTYTVFFVLQIFLYLSIPLCAHQVSVSPSVVWLVYFYASTMLIFSMYGGGFATLPAYLSDMFGTKCVGGIHGRTLTAWSVAGVLGPLAITSLREASLASATRDLAAQTDPAAFHAAFGAGPESLEALMTAKTVTLAKLLEIAPPGAVDPSSSLYNTTMYLMAALLAVALVANLLVRPVDPKHHLPEAE